MHDEEEEEEVWNDIILAVEFQLVHTAVHKAALQPSQECKLQTTCTSSGATGDAPAGEGDTKLRNVASFLAEQISVFSFQLFPNKIFSFQFTRTFQLSVFIFPF